MGKNPASSFEEVQALATKNMTFNGDIPRDEQEDESTLDPIEIEIDRLASLSDLQYVRERKKASKRLDIGLSALDAIVKGRRREQGQGKTFQGQEVVFDDIVPADEPVDGALLLQKIRKLLLRFLVLPTGAAVAISLWIIRAYAHELFGVNPRLTFLSPEKRCGKTTTLDLVGQIVPRPLLSSNASPSSVFRVIEKVQPTLILDEMDSFHDCHEELRGILNSGHTKAAARVIRNVGDDNEPRSFSTWCPMIFAAIGKLPDTIMDRSITIPMDRKKKTDKVARLTQKAKNSSVFKEDVEAIRRECVRWVHDHQEALAEADPDIIEDLSDRANDNWSGLFAIAEICGREWFEKAQDAALQLAGKEPATETKGVELLTDIRIIFDNRMVKQIPSKNLCEELADLEERPWATWGRGNKPITQVQLATQLRKFGISSRNIKTPDESVKRGYPKEDFEEPWERYCTFPPENQVSKRYPATSCMDKGETSVFQSATDEPGSVSKNGTLGNTGAENSAVALQNTKSGRENKEIEKEALNPWT